jgi:hypothetical protein
VSKAWHKTIDRWGEENGFVEKETGRSLGSSEFSSIVELIRFPLMDGEFLREHVVFSDVLSLEDAFALLDFFHR